MNVFERYAPFIQDYIYRSGWQALRGVQNAAGDAIFNTQDNVLLTASTASGSGWMYFYNPASGILHDPHFKSYGFVFADGHAGTHRFSDLLKMPQNFKTELR